MSKDPANARAEARSKQGLSRELQQNRTDLPADPSKGGSRGYPVWARQDDLQRLQTGLPTRASASSLRRWTNRITPYQQTGNKARQNLTRGDQLLMSIFLFAWPEAEADEVATYIYNNSGNLYSRQDISSRMKDLDLTKKVASTEAYQAFEPRNVLRVQLFWSQPPPLGVRTIARRKFIDADEFGIAIQKCNRKSGHAYVSVRIRKPGHYCRDTKLTVLFAVEPGDPRLPPHMDGSVQKPRRWIRVTRLSGTTATTFADFCDYICTDIETNPIPNTDDHRVFLWDNLSSHLSPIVVQTVEGRNGPIHFAIVKRPAYEAKYAPIEYKILDIVNELKRNAHPDWDTNQLEQEIYLAASRIGMNGSFDATFDHCGYTVTGN